ncbi:MAG: hypothetical protein PHY80_04500 [Rickettsiales bacterium]|nr:hypothetical protein [Rickettsiales bacterium]
MKKIICSLLLLVFLSNCISVKKNNVPTIQDDQLKTSSTKKSKIFLDWNYSTNISLNQKQSIIDKMKSAHSKLFLDIIKESGCCDIVYEKDEADVIVNGGFYDESSNAGIYFAYLTGLSFGIIPSWINANMKIEANVQNRKITKDYVLKDSMFVATWLPFVLAMPFNGNSIEKEGAIQKNLYRNLLVEMKNDKIIK